MSRYELLIFLHIASAIIWVGAGFLFAVLVFGAERVGDRLRTMGYQRDVGWLAPRLFVPASLATMVFGVLLVIDGFWTFEYLWITIAMVGWFASFVMGFFYFKPEGERIGALAESQGPEAPEVNSRLHRLTVIDRLQLTVLFLVLADMVLKPTGDDSDLLIGGGGILAVALVLAALSIRRGAPRTAAA